MSASREPVPFEPYQSGVYLHGTKANLAVGDLLARGANRTSRRAE
jgi:rifampin ADP-ribosylating transferase